MKRGGRTLSIFIFVILFALSSCAPGQDAASGNSIEETAASSGGETAADAHAAVSRDENSGMTKMVRLGSSLYSIRIAREFSHMRVSNEDWEDGMVASYHNENTLLDFSVYQFSKEGYPDTLEEFVSEEAEEYEASEVVTGETINGIAVGYYRSMDEYGGVFREGVTYVLENGDEYIEVDFWFIGYQAEGEAREIIHSLTLIGSEPLALGAYRIRIPLDFRLVSREGANPAVYISGSDSLRLYVTRFPAGEMSLTDFACAQALQRNGTDIDTDAEINGIPAALYRSVEALGGAFHSTLTCVLDDGDGFTELTFCLDGIAAEAEADALLNTLSMRP